MHDTVAERHIKHFYEYLQCVSVMLFVAYFVNINNSWPVSSQAVVTRSHSPGCPVPECRRDPGWTLVLRCHQWSCTCASLVTSLFLSWFHTGASSKLAWQISLFVYLTDVIKWMNRLFAWLHIFVLSSNMMPISLWNAFKNLNLKPYVPRTVLT